MAEHDTHQPGNGSWAIEYLRLLKSASQSLKEALLKRDPEAIFSAVSEQENIIKGFQSPEYAGNGMAGIDTDEIRHEAKALAASIKQQQRASRALAKSFLNVVDKTLCSLSAKAGHDVVTYNSTGGLGSRASSILIHQTG